MTETGILIDVAVGGWNLREADAEKLLMVARTAEQAGIDSLTIADAAALGLSVNGEFDIEPLMTCSFLAGATSTLRLVATMSTRWHPYTGGRRLASLDHVSAGRAGWHLPALSDAPTFAEARMSEFAQVVTSLWEGWSPQSVTADAQGVVRVNPDQVRPLDHRGTHFTVKGPLDIPRPPQGRIPLFKSWSSPADTPMAAAYADVVVARIGQAGAVAELRQSLDDACRLQGRPHDAVKLLVAWSPELKKDAAIADAPSLSGSIEKSADAMETIIAAGADGFRIMLHDLQSDLPRYLDTVMPVLSKLVISPRD